MNRGADYRKLAGRLVLAGFDGLFLPVEIRELLENDALLGIIVFKRNAISFKQVFDLNESVRRAAPPERPPVIAVDQEGGRVARLREPLTVLPCARRFGAIDDPALTRKAGLLTGLELSALGFTLNFAPVLDVDTNPLSPVIGDRSFGRTPDAVERHGLAFAEGLSQGGIIPCAKHFPGHGDADTDSHLALPVTTHDRERLEAVEMRPFAAWAKADLGPVMTAHVLYPALDKDFPAGFSRAAIEGELRGRLGFQGAVLTDDLEMGGAAGFGGPGSAAVRAVQAGADGLLVCRHVEHVTAVIDALTREATGDSAFFQRMEKAAARLQCLHRIPSCNISYIGSSDHASLVREVMSAFTGAST